MATSRQASAQSTTEQGVIATLLTGAIKLVFFLLLTLVFSIFTEWFGITVIWPDQGSQHSQQMLERELGYLNDDFKHSGLVEQPKQVADQFAAVFHRYLVEATSIEALIQWLAQPKNTNTVTTGFRLRLRGWSINAAEYLQSTVTISQVFATRLAILTLALPAFVLLSLVGMVDGLVQRDIRRWSGGRETSFVYHWAKRLVLPSMYLPWIMYLAMPVSVHPNLVVLPFALVCALSVAIMATTFKKYV
ncbi:MAG: TIGR03747 family integrating conjugative element membrane protein [Gammaproteobacteria bacterium]|nr:TIGR03747 family integrating conjugative element membrane protein [Gammaproteobacteria bacterium]